MDPKLHPLIQKRRSPRAFSTQPIEQDVINRLFEAARWSPSCFNEQPWRFVYARKKDSEEYQRLFECLTEGNRKWVGNAPLLVLTLAKKSFSHNDKPNRWAWHDVGLAVANMTFQATELDIYLHQMAGFNSGKAVSTFGLTGDYEPVSMIAIGYLGDVDDLPDDVASREDNERVRKPLDQIAFAGMWPY